MRFDHPAYDDWEKREISPTSGPTHLTLLSTGRCNLSCFMCVHSVAEEIPVRMNPETIAPFLQKAQRVFLAGGEPLWMTDTVNRVGKRIFSAIIERHGHLKINAFTNGALLNGELAEIVMTRFESIHFSVDSVDPAVYAKVRGRPLLGNVVKNMERLARMKRERGLKSGDAPHINMNSIVMNSTVAGLPAAAEKLAELGGYKHLLIGLKNTIGPTHHAAVTEEVFRPDSLSPGALSAIRDRLRRIHAKAGIVAEDQCNLLGGGASKPRAAGVEAVCAAPWVTADIREDGAVYCCCANTIGLGNVNDRTFDEIWNGPEACGLREAFARGEMRGCVQEGCPAPNNYFAVDETSCDTALLENLRRKFPEGKKFKTILLLRTAPLYRSHIATRSLARAFPEARITLVTPLSSVGDCRAWGMGMDVRGYPERIFDPRVFTDWWKETGAEKNFGLAAAVYNNEGGKGYEAVKAILRLAGAERAVGITPGGELADI